MAHPGEDFRHQEDRLEFLDTVRRLRLVDAGILSKLGYNERTAQRWLSSLFERGLLEESPARRMRQARVYRLAQDGYERVRDYLWNPMLPDYQRKWKPPAWSRLGHDLEVARISASLYCEGLAAGMECDILPMEEGYQKVFKGPGKPGIIVMPDSVVLLGSYAIGVEYERSRHTASIKRKLDRWRAYQLSRGWEERYVKPLVPLFVAEESGHLQKQGAVARAGVMHRVVEVVKAKGLEMALVGGASGAYVESWQVLATPHFDYECGLLDALEAITGGLKSAV